jgi:hypothetical protein
MDEDTNPRDGADEAASAPMQRGALGAWWREGARSAFLLEPNWTGLQATPGIVACLVGVTLLMGLLVERLYIDGPAHFYWPSLELGWLPLAATSWICWLALPQTANETAGTPRPAALFAMLSAQSLTIGIMLALVFVPIVRGGSYAPLNSAVSTALWLLAIGWLAAALLAVSILYYAVIYTIWLKPRTPQNIVIGGGAGAVYGISAAVLSSVFLLLSLRVGLRTRAPEGDRMKPEKQLFGYSVIYLFALFAALVADHWLLVQGSPA